MAVEGTVHWGILGAGGIAKRFAASLAGVEGTRLVAVSGRTAGRLAAFAPARIYADGSDGAAAHERLLADPEVDAVYLALPHSMHARWAASALRAGKAVLCEKPAALTADEAREIAAVARETGMLFVEAMKCRFVPLHSRVQALLGTGELGQVRRIDCAQLVDYGEGRLGYLTALARWKEVSGGRVDWAGRAELAFAGGVEATVAWAGDSANYDCSCLITCENGSIAVERAHRPERAVVHRAGRPDEVVEAPYDPDDFHGEIAHFCGLLRSGAVESPVMPLAATVRNAELLDAVRARM